MKWDRPRYRLEGKQTEDARGADQHPGPRSRRRRRKKVRKTMLSDGSVVDGALTSEEVEAAERAIAQGKEPSR